MKTLPVVFASPFLSVLFIGPAHAGDDPGKSPEDVFKAFAFAVKKEDARAAMSHLTRDSQSLVAGSMWFGASVARAIIEGIQIPATGRTREALEGITAIDEFLKRHGLSDDLYWKILEKEKKALALPVDVHDIATFVTLGEFIKNKPAFVADSLLKPSAAKEYLFKEIREANVKDVKIEGLQAKGQATFPGATSFAVTGTIYFKLEGAVWKIDVLETHRNWPPLPASPQAQRPATEVQPPAADHPSRPRLLPRLFPRLRGQ